MDASIWAVRIEAVRGVNGGTGVLQIPTYLPLGGSDSDQQAAIWGLDLGPGTGTLCALANF